MNRPWKTWVIFGFAFAILLAAMGWVSLTALRLDNAQRDARRQAEFEEKVRLALWRMDSLLAPLIVQESSRQYFAYNPSYVAGRGYNRMYGALRNDEILLPSPLLTETSTNVILHFQFDPSGTLSSPQVAAGLKGDSAEENGSRQQGAIAVNRAKLNELKSLITPKALELACSTNISTTISANRMVEVASLGQGAKLSQAEQSQQKQFILNNVELQARTQMSQQAANSFRNFENGWEIGSNIAEGMVTPSWFGEALVLARRVSVGNQTYFQGAWLNWGNIQKWLLASAKELLPEARLEPLKNNAPDLQGRMLASLPVRLIPGSLPKVSRGQLTPTQYALGIAWGCVLLAAIAVGVLLHGTVSLSERRGAFVSAVTHELRTPLTTFKMYSEMLAEGMVQDPEKQKSYLGTLSSEANRLSHLVENVLAYARLERGSARRRVERISIHDLLDRVKFRLIQRSEQAGMTLEVDSDAQVLATKVHVDVAAIEQILFNLVDNACKYAAPAATEKIIHLEALPDGKFTMLRVRDHGQGISKEGARRLFRPFSKSANEAAHSAPGVGLGLALCRRLSRSMGGDLRLDQLVAGGACFVLMLPTSTAEGTNIGPASLT